jgi:Holliday junction resolvasome RuvABC ATP-dependent DNA helicase subunit
LQGSKGAGKTDFAWRFSKIPETPFCELDASDLKKPEQIIEGMRQTLGEFGTPLVAERVTGSMSYFTAPPMGLFIDEIQQLSKHMQDAMLKMTAQNDRTLRTSTATINCRKVYIIGATTHPGDLREALVSRFTVITLERHCLAEIAKIVNGKYPDWKLSDCLKVAKMQPVSRNALDFAEHVTRACRRHNCDISKGIEMVGKRLGLDDSGLNSQAINSLIVLAQAGDAGLSKKAICVSIGIEEEQFTNSVLPLLLPTELHTAFVRITNKHYITDAGLEELRRRGYAV